MAGPRRIILEALTPVEKVLQHFGKPESKISIDFATKATASLQNGDVLISREDWRFTNLLIPGTWGHAAIYYNGSIIEAIGTYKENGVKKSGVRSTSPGRWIYQKDSIAILRAKFASKEEASLAGLLAENQIGVEYDYLFTPSTKAFYCSELITYAYIEALKINGKESPFVFKKYMGVETSTPQDLYDATDKFELILEELN